MWEDEVLKIIMVIQRAVLSIEEGRFSRVGEGESSRTRIALVKRFSFVFVCVVPDLLVCEPEATL